MVLENVGLKDLRMKHELFMIDEMELLKRSSINKRELLNSPL
jgi:hypothetical protein